MDKVEKIKMKKSVELIRALQKMFAGMLLSNVKYQDPTEVLESIVDDNGDPISIYEQKDIGEFFLNLLDRLQDGLGENKQLIRKLVAADFDRQSMKIHNEKNNQDENMKELGKIDPNDQVCDSFYYSNFQFIMFFNLYMCTPRPKRFFTLQKIDILTI